MKQLFEYITNNICDRNILLEEALIDTEDLINESFQCELLTNLASQIKKAEKKNNINKIERAKQHDEQYPYSDGSKHDPHIVSFTSIFGPLTVTGKYQTKRGIQGLKWSEITDDDFVLVKAGNEKELKKALKPIYAKNGKGDAIVCLPDTKNPIMFIKGYGKDDDKRLYYFNMDQARWDAGVKEKTATKYSYQTRPLKLDEVMPLISDCDVYILNITDELIKSYQILQTTRDANKEGMINYDESSLKDMFKKQKARYKTMVEEIKARKLQKRPELLFDEIKKVNDEVYDLYKEVMSDPENIDKYFDLGNLMNYVSHAYESFYRSMKSSRDAEKFELRFPNNTADSYNRAKARSEINDAKEYIDRVRKSIAEIKQNLK